MAVGRNIDWERIESEYRAGLLSVREIAAAHNITHGAINKRKNRDKWERDLSARIKAKADALVSKAEVSDLVSKERLATDIETVEVNAQAIANIRLSHRKDISRAKTLAMLLLGEVEGQTVNLELLEKLGELMASPDGNGYDRLNEVYRKVIATPSRIDGIKKLSDAMKTLVTMEREAWGITEKSMANEYDEAMMRQLFAAMPIEFAREVKAALAQGKK